MTSSEIDGNVNGAEGKDSLAKFIEEMTGAGCDVSVIGKILERIKAERSATEAAAARIFFNGAPSKPLSALQLADELRELRQRSILLELAIIGAWQEGKVEDGFEALAFHAAELARGVARIERAFAAEIQMNDRPLSD